MACRLRNCPATQQQHNNNNNNNNNPPRVGNNNNTKQFRNVVPSAELPIDALPMDATSYKIGALVQPWLKRSAAPLSAAAIQQR
jgi:hypothetical protein